MLIGHVGNDPEVRYVDKDKPVATISLATKIPSRMTKEGTKIPESTDWHKIYFWNNLGKTVEQYVHKGDKLYVEGALHYHTYTDKTGRSCTRVEIWAEKLEIFTPAKTDQI